MEIPILDLDLHQYQDKLKVKKEGDQTYLWDMFRKKYIVLQPEELVRQLVALYFINELKYPQGYIQLERGVRVHQMEKRFDMIIRDKHVQPFMLIECKSFKTKLKQETFDQVSHYNTKIKAPFILITNGIQTLCAQIDRVKSTYSFVDIPPYPA
jgi:hypothetical protein